MNEGLRRRRLGILVSLLAVALGATAFAAGGSESKAAATAPGAGKAWVGDDPLTVTMMIADNPTFPWNDNWGVVQEIRKRANVILKPVVVPIADYPTKFNLLMATSDIPDVIQLANADWTGFAQNGKFMPVSDHMKELPDLQMLIQKWNLSQEWQNATLLDGKNYVLPGVLEKPAYTEGLAMRKDVMKRLNLAIPTTMDQLYTVLKAMKASDPKSLPWTGFWGSDCLLWFMGPSYNSFNVGGWSAPALDPSVYYNLDTKKFEPSMTSPKLQAIVVYLNKLYRDGLLDPELFTQDVDQWQQKIVTGKSFVSYDWADQNAGITANGKTTNADFLFENVPTLTGVGITKNNFVFQHTYDFLAVSSAAAAKPTLPKLLQYLNWKYYTEEGAVLGAWGLKDVTYTVNPDGTHKWAEALQASKDGPVKAAQAGYGASADYFMTIQYFDYQLAVASTPTVRAISEQQVKNAWLPAKPRAKLSVDQTEQMKLLSAPLKDFFDKSFQAFVMGTSDPVKDWDAYVKEANAKGIQKIVDIFNAALAAQTK